jgi:hypothetical protein
MVLALASCSASETPEQCIERFARQFPNEQMFDSGSWRSNLTFRLADGLRLEDIDKRATFTIASGPEQAAFDRFAKQDVPAEGAYLAVNDAVYLRTRGPVGSPKETAAAGCAEGPRGSQLVRIDWVPEPRETNN